MTIGRRLIVSFALLAGVVGVSGQVVYQRVAQLLPKLARVVDQSLPEVEALYGVRDRLHRVLGATRGYLLLRTDADRTTAREALAQLDAAIDGYAQAHAADQETGLAPNDQPLERDLRRMAENVRDIATEVIDIPGDKVTRTHVLLFSTRVAQVLMQGDQIIKTGVERESGELRALTTRLEVDIDRLRMLARGTTSLALSLAFVLAAWLTYRITRPTRHLTGVARAIADGDLQRRATIRSRDEVGVLATAFNAMADTLVAQQDDLRRAEAEARHLAEEQGQLAELKSRFVMMASHEFRTPLAVISAASEALLHYTDRMTPAQRSDRLQRIQREIRHMNGLLEDVLTLGRSDAEKLECDRQPVDLTALCAEVLDEVQSTVPTTHRLLLDARSRARTVAVDPRLIRQVLLNLMGNAVKYSPSGGDVRCSIDDVANGVTIGVQDAGIGIPVADQARLFEPFHRGANVGVIPGTGLGLPIIKRIVDLHGGTIAVESVVGQGTTVRVHLSTPTG